MGEIRVPVPARTGFGHVFPLCEFSVSGEVGGGGGIFLKGSRKIFNCLLFALKGLHVFFSVAILAQFFQTSGHMAPKRAVRTPAQNKAESFLRKEIKNLMALVAMAHQTKIWICGWPG